MQPPASEMPDVKDSLLLVGVEVEGTTPAQVAAAYPAERNNMPAIVRDLGVSLKN